MRNQTTISRGTRHPFARLFPEGRVTSRAPFPEGTRHACNRLVALQLSVLAPARSCCRELLAIGRPAYSAMLAARPPRS